MRDTIGGTDTITPIAAVSYADLISLIADIRDKSGVGDKPMLSELAEAIHIRIEEFRKEIEAKDVAMRESDELVAEAARELAALTVELTRTRAMLGCARHAAAVATIGHEEHNRMIALFDGAGFRGVYVEEQARRAVAELKDARSRLARLDDLDASAAAMEAQ
jgi:hypothetical protein